MMLTQRLRRCLPRWPSALDMPAGQLPFDGYLAASALLLMLTGLVMIGSASMDVAARDFGSPYFFLKRHLFFVGLALITVVLVSRFRIDYWERFSTPLLFVGGVLLLLVFLPGIGREVNGSKRWINAGVFNLQTSEVAKICLVVYISAYLVRRLSEVRGGWLGIIKPVLPLAVYCTALILQPDFGATVVLAGAVMGMIFLGGMGILQFTVTISAAGVLAWLMATFQPYRVQRLQTFLDPWADPFGAGYQLSQAQIAFGRGEWSGSGLGNSIQKLFFLPEAHTDFIYSILAEELGLVAALAVICVYALLIARIFMIGRRGEKMQELFRAYLCYGFGFIFAAQALINIGVNVGALPTKGLTLPLLSYGGSSLLASAVMLGMVLRIDYELKRKALAGVANRGRR